jgi:hypothetical protein
LGEDIAPASLQEKLFLQLQKLVKQNLGFNFLIGLGG